MALEHTLDSDKSSEPAVTVFRPSQYLGEACCRGSVLADIFSSSSRKSCFSSIGRYLCEVDSDLSLLHLSIPSHFYTQLGTRTWSLVYLAATKKEGCRVDCSCEIR